MSLYDYYVEATKMMGAPSWSDVKDELEEFINAKTPKEMSKESADVLHALCRYIRLPNKLTWLIANKTAVKHAVRVLVRRCPRSERNCMTAAENCCCKK